MPPNKKKKLERETLPLTCEFSKCCDTCDGYKAFNNHIRIHIDMMRQQLDEIVCTQDGRFLLPNWPLI